MDTKTNAKLRPGISIAAAFPPLVEVVADGSVADDEVSDVVVVVVVVVTDDGVDGSGRKGAVGNTTGVKRLLELDSDSEKVSCSEVDVDVLADVEAGVSS